jgi:hypothetical protein
MEKITTIYVTGAILTSILFIVGMYFLHGKVKQPGVWDLLTWMVIFSAWPIAFVMFCVDLARWQKQKRI